MATTLAYGQHHCHRLWGYRCTGVAVADLQRSGVAPGSELTAIASHVDHHTLPRRQSAAAIIDAEPVCRLRGKRYRPVKIRRTCVGNASLNCELSVSVLSLLKSSSFVETLICG